MKFRTKSGSLYEVNGVRIRQVSGYATQRVGPEWAEAVDIDVHIGRPAIIRWPIDDVRPSHTVTSIVEEIDLGF